MKTFNYNSFVFAITVIFFLGGSVCSPNIVFCQDNGQEVSRNSLFMQKKSVVPPSPNAANLGKYGDININNFTGALTLQIPIHGIRGNDIGTSVSLSYDGSGNKVDNLPSLVGIGWTLNAGSVITRSVQGKPDMSFNYFGKDSELYNLPNYNDLKTTNEFYYKIAKGDLEPQPDIYYFNFGGFSGKFVFKANKQIVMKDSKDMTITPSWSTDDDISSFMVTDAAGNKYYFMEAELTSLTYDYSMQAGSDHFPNRTNFTFNSAWYLTKIETANGNETIEFDYTTTNQLSGQAYYERPQNLDAYKSITYTRQTYPSNQTTPSVSFSSGLNSTTKIYNRKFINSIIYKLGTSTIEKVEFVKSAANLLRNGQPVTTDGYKLDEIKLYGGVNATSGLRKFNFVQDGSTNRLTLKSLEEESLITPSLPKKIHAFTYDSEPLPAPTSNGIDHWGYYNGATGNTGLIPSYSSYTGQSAARGSNDIAKAAILTQVKYPTQGYSVFEHELHQIAGANSGDPERQVGGLRVREIKNYDINGTLLFKKQYAYVLENSTASSGILLGDEPSYVDIGSRKEYAPEVQCANCGLVMGYSPSGIIETSVNQFTTLYSASRSNLGSVQGSIVGYSRIEEITDGKVVYHFRTVKLSPFEWDDNDNGNLLKKQVFRAGDNKLLSETTNTYESDARREVMFSSYSTESDPQQDNLSQLCYVYNPASQTYTYIWRQPANFYANTLPCITTNVFKTRFRLSAGITFRQSWKTLKQSTDKQFFYDANGALTNTITTVSNNTYGNVTITQPTETTVLNSDNSVYKTKIYFTQDAISAGNSQNSASTLSTMVGKSMLGFLDSHLKCNF